MVHFIWPAMTEKHFSLPLTKNDIPFGHVRMYAMPYLLDLIEWTFKRELKTMVHFIWFVMTEKHYQSRYTLW